MDAAFFAMMSAALLSMISAIFGVAMARLLWANDLVFAKHIDEIRSKTEQSLRRQLDSKDEIIASSERIIETQESTIEILKQSVNKCQ